jgi:hypothetical protein
MFQYASNFKSVCLSAIINRILDKKSCSTYKQATPLNPTTNEWDL